MVVRGLKIGGLVAAFLIVAAVIIAGIIWQTHSTAIATRLEKLAQEFLIANDSTRIGISSVSGNPLGSLTLHDVSLSVKDGEDWRNFFAARKIRLSYRAFELVQKKYVLDHVELEEPVFSLTKGGRGKYLWPRFGKGGKGKGTKVEIGSLVLRNGKLRIGRRGENGSFDDISLNGSLASGASGLALDGLELSFVASTWKYRVESCRGKLLFHEGKMWIDSVQVSTAESRYTLNGYLGLKSPSDIEIEALIEMLSIAELRGIRKLSFLPAEGKLGGKAGVVRKDLGATQITSLLSGTYGPHAVESLEAVTSIRRGHWENQFRMESGGSVMEGTFSAGPGTQQECAVDFVRFDPRVWPEVFKETDIPAGSLNGAFRFSGNSLTSSDRKGEIQVSFDGGSYAGVSFLEGKAQGSFDGEGRLVFSSIDFVGAGYSANSSGTIGPGGNIDLIFNASVEKLGAFAQVKDKFDFDGEIALRGKLCSTGKRLTVETGVDGKLGRTLPSSVSGVVNSGLVEGELWPLLSLNAKVLLSPGEVRGFAFDSLSMETVIRGSQHGNRRAESAEEEGGALCSLAVVVVSGSARAVRSDTVVSVTGALDCCRNGVGIKIGSLKATLGQMTWESGRNISLEWRLGTLKVEEFALSSGESRIEFVGAFEPARGNAAGRLRVGSLDVRNAVGRRLPLAGKVDADVAFEQAESAFSVDGGIDWSDAAVGARTLDRLSLSASVKNKDVQVRGLELVRARGRIAASGEVQLPVDFAQFVRSVSSSHSVPGSVQAKLDLRMTELNLSEFSGWHPSLTSLSGVIDGEGTLEGFIENPRVTVSLDAKDFRIKEYQVEGLELRATLEDSVCRISRLSMMEKNAKGEVVGFFPVSLNLGTGRVSFPDGALNLDVKLPESDFSVVSLFVKQIASASGLISGEAQLRGTLKNPTLKGGFEIKSASLRPAGREEVLEGFDAQITLNERAIELVKFTAAQGEDGRLEGNGRILLTGSERGEYSFRIKGKRVTFGDAEDIALKFDCDLVISSVELRDRGTYPKITGKIDVRQGIIAREFEAAQGPQKEQRWLCDIEVEVLNNLWLKNINAEIELAGSLTARKDVSGLILLGSLRILRGKYYVFDNEFRISAGTLEFKDVGQINPEMNIQAETRASGRRVFLALTGKLSEPNIALSSEDPNLSQTDVLRLLTVGKYAAAEPGQTGDGGLMPGVTGSVGNYFLRQVERRLARELKWVDSIELGSGMERAGSLSELRWGLGKYITPELYLRYSQGLTRTSERDVSVEYRLSDLLFLRGGVVSRDRFTGRERDEYNLDLRLKYEY